jgi:tetratricopeptide (TPR) repeat protein
MTDDLTEAARAQFAVGDFAAGHASALEALGGDPDNLELLLVAGRSAIKIGSGDALAHLRRATEIAPGDARAWSALGEALLAAGENADADAAFAKAVAIDPSSGRGQADPSPVPDSRAGMSTASISLVDMYRSFGQLDDALAHAKRLSEAAPDDIMARLDVAELSLETGNFDDARAAFEKLRELDDAPGHAVYPLHGLIRVAIAQERWDQARELLGQVDAAALGVDVEAFPPPELQAVEAALDASLAGYRQIHADDRRANAGQILG